jgi:hypothetical protein
MNGEGSHHDAPAKQPMTDLHDSASPRFMTFYHKVIKTWKKRVSVRRKRRTTVGATPGYFTNYSSNMKQGPIFLRQKLSKI